jgi:hypothetical protein
MVAGDHQNLSTKPTDPLVKSTFPGGLRDREAEDLQIIEGPEVAHVATDAGTGPEEDQDAAAGAPRHVVLIDLGDAGAEIRRRLQQACADDGRRPDAEALLAAERNPDDQVARRRERVAAARVGLAVEIRTESEVALDTEDAAAHEGKARAPVELAGVERFENCLPESPPKFTPKNGMNMTVCPRRHRRECDRDECNCDDSG